MKKIKKPVSLALMILIIMGTVQLDVNAKVQNQLQTGDNIKNHGDKIYVAKNYGPFAVNYSPYMYYNGYYSEEDKVKADFVGFNRYNVKNTFNIVELVVKVPDDWSEQDIEISLTTQTVYDAKGGSKTYHVRGDGETIGGILFNGNIGHKDKETRSYASMFEYEIALGHEVERSYKNNVRNNFMTFNYKIKNVEPDEKIKISFITQAAQDKAEISTSRSLDIIEPIDLNHVKQTGMLKANITSINLSLDTELYAAINKDKLIYLGKIEEFYEPVDRVISIDKELEDKELKDMDELYIVAKDKNGWYTAAVGNGNFKRGKLEKIEYDGSTEIELDKSLAIGDGIKFLPENSYEDYKIKVIDGIENVETNGNELTGKKLGEFKVEITTDDSEKSTIVDMKVVPEKVPSTDITIINPIETLEEGLQHEYKHVLTPLESTDKVTYKTLNEDIVKISGNTILGLKKGNAIIQATTESGKFTTTSVEVVEGPPLMSIEDLDKNLELIKDRLTKEMTQEDKDFFKAWLIRLEGHINRQDDGDEKDILLDKLNGIKDDLNQKEVIDTTYTPVTVTAETTEDWGQTKIIKVKVDGDLDYLELPDGSKTLSNEIDYRVNENKSYAFTAYGKDGRTKDSDIIDINKIDTTSPIIAINTVTDDTDKIRIDVTDLGSGVDYLELPDGTEVQAQADKIRTQVDLKDIEIQQLRTGIRMFTFKAYDKAGNVSKAEYIWNKADGRAPITVVTEGNPTQWQNFNAKLLVTAYSEDGIKSLDLEKNLIKQGKSIDIEELYSIFDTDEYNETELIVDEFEEVEDELISEKFQTEEVDEKMEKEMTKDDSTIEEVDEDVDIEEVDEEKEVTNEDFVIEEKNEDINYKDTVEKDIVVEDNMEIHYFVTSGSNRKASDKIDVTKIDKEAPKIELKLNVEEGKVEYKISDDLSGIDEITISNGEVIDGNGKKLIQGSFPIGDKKEFSVMTRDLATNTSSEIIRIESNGNSDGDNGNSGNNPQQKPEEKPSEKPTEKPNDNNSNHTEKPSIDIEIGGGTESGRELTEEELNKVKDAIVEKLEIEWHYSYINGYPAEDFRPNDYISRAEAGSILTRIMNEGYKSNLKSSELPFKDMNMNKWYDAEIAQVYSTGIINGYEDNTFRPEEPITRAEIATILQRFLDAEFDNMKVEDDIYSIKGHWAEESINTIITLGFMNGYDDGSFRPEDNMTRAEFVKTINNILGRKPKLENMKGLTPKWTDVALDKWYSVDVYEASIEHDYKVIDGKEIWTEVK